MVWKSSYRNFCSVRSTLRSSKSSFETFVINKLQLVISSFSLTQLVQLNTFLILPRFSFPFLVLHLLSGVMCFSLDPFYYYYYSFETYGSCLRLEMRTFIHARWEISIGTFPNHWNFILYVKLNTETVIKKNMNFKVLNFVQIEVVKGQLTQTGESLQICMKLPLKDCIQCIVSEKVQFAMSQTSSSYWNCQM